MEQPPPSYFLSGRGTWCKTWNSGVRALIISESLSYSQVSGIQNVSVELSIAKSLTWQYLLLTEWTLRRLRLRNVFLAKSVVRFFFAVKVSFFNYKSPCLCHSGALTRKSFMFEVSLTILYAFNTLLQRVSVTILSFVPFSTFATGSWHTLVLAFSSEMVELITVMVPWYKEVVKTFRTW